MYTFYAAENILSEPAIVAPPIRSTVLRTIPFTGWHLVFGKYNYSVIQLFDIFVTFVTVCLLLCGDIHPLPKLVERELTSQAQYNLFKKRGLHYLHLNTKSLLPKIDELRLIARKTNATCICISGTWVDDFIYDTEICIENYNIIRKERNRHSGGVCIYIRSDLAFNPRPDISNNDFEAVFCECLLHKCEPILCGTLCRPPNILQYFRESVFKLLSFYFTWNNSFRKFQYWYV